MTGVMPVGARARVAPSPGTSGVAVTDENGAATGPTLGADATVEIVAWRPRGRSGGRYRVRSLDGGAEGWVDGSVLREIPRAPVARRPTKLPAGPVPRGIVSARPRRGGS